MCEFLYYLAWEWLNVALEFTAVAWVRLPRFFWAVVGVNIITHPVFMFLLERFGHDSYFVLKCEMVIPIVEWLLLMVVYGCSRWRQLLGVSVLMNVVSYGTGLLIEMSP